MPRLTTFLLAGALSWPAVSHAQDVPPLPEPPKVPQVGVPASPYASDAGAVKRVRTDSGKPDSLPGLPPLPPGSVGSTVDAAPAPPARPVEELPKPGAAPSGSTPPGVPDISGMPGAGPMSGPGMLMGPGGCLPPSGTYVPCAPPVCCPPPECEQQCGSGCIVWGDALWLRPRRADPVAFMSNTVGTVTETDFSQYDTKFTFAFRAGFGSVVDGWVISAEYTEFKDTISDQVFAIPAAAGGVNVIYVGPGQLNNQGPNPGGALATSWNLQYRTIDLMTGAVYNPNHFLDILVAGGIRVAWVDQEYKTTIDNSNAGGGITAEDLALNLRGAGPRVGAEARIYLAPCTVLYGRSYVSTLLAHRQDNSIQTQTQGPTVLAVIAGNYEREEIVPVVELAIGAEYWCCGGRVILSGGYEYNYWWQLGNSATDALAQTGVSTHNNISLDGVFCRVSWVW